MKFKVYVIGRDHSPNWDGTEEKFQPVDMKFVESDAQDVKDGLNRIKYPSDYYIKEMYVDLFELHELSNDV
jgi:hypothetical protein